MIMDLLEAVARTGVFAVTLVLFPLMAMAYRRVRTPRMFLVAVAFGLFLFSGTVLFSEVLNDDINRMVSPGMDYSLILIALTVLAAALLRRDAVPRDS
jgi:O-antigen/teichoic acid export membrane protein